MKFTALSLVLALVFTSAFALAGDAPDAILKQITDSKAAIEALEGGEYCKKRKCVFITFWDFDGTILKGDCSEGLTVDGKPVYPGLAQAAIEAGLSQRFRKDEFPRFWKEYKESEVHDHLAAYEFLTKAFAGAKQADLIAFSERHFQSALAPYIFSSSKRILEGLKENGVLAHVVSASPQYFVEGAAATGIAAKDRIDGISSRLNKGIVTDNVERPITYAEGKVARIQKILARMRKKEKTSAIFVLGAFGNSYPTDGAFLQHVLEKPLPAGKPIATMINGSGAQGGFKGKFFEVAFE